MNRLLAVFALSMLVSCGFTPEKPAVTDPRIAPLLSAAQQFDRLQYGFTPIPTNGEVRLEVRRAGGAYDRMLHFYGRTSRTMAFRQTAPVGSGFTNRKSSPARRNTRPWTARSTSRLS